MDLENLLEHDNDESNLSEAGEEISNNIDPDTENQFRSIADIDKIPNR